MLLVEEGHSQASGARLLHTSAYRVHVWQERFVAEGRTGLVDRPRGGRPHTLSADDWAYLEAALEQGPQAHGVPVTIWSIRELQALLQRERGVAASVSTVHRAVQALGSRYRRPRHDLTHRQDAQAAAAAGWLLDWLQNKQLVSPEDSIWSIGMNVKSTPIPTRQRSGGARGSR